MSDIPMWMLYVVVLHCIATGKSYPFIEKDKMVRDIRKHVLGEQLTNERTENLMEESDIIGETNQFVEENTPEKLSTFSLTEKTKHFDMNVSNINSTINNFTNSTSNETNTNKNLPPEKLTSRTLTELDVYDSGKSDNKNNHISSYLIHLPHYLQKYLQKENPLKGFLRETIFVPGHRKSRHRRSFYFDFDIFNTDFDDSEENDVVFSAHTSPCNWSDRFYCLNGGTCVFVHALEIKTCRCKIGYTGLRCEMLNQEFLLALLSEEFFG